MKKILLFSMLLLFAIAGRAQANVEFADGDYKFKFNSTGKVVYCTGLSETGMAKKPLSIFIPNVATYNVSKYYVSEIADGAFSSLDFITDVTVPYGITHIGMAFIFCSNLETVDLPGTLLGFDDYAFSKCTSLSRIFSRALTPPHVRRLSTATYPNVTVYVPNVPGLAKAYKSAWSALNVKDVKYNNMADIEITYSSCPSYYAIITGEPPVGIIDKVVNIDATVVRYGSSSTTEGTMRLTPSYDESTKYRFFITAIADSALTGRTDITKITNADHAKKIGRAAFAGCTALTEVSLYADSIKAQAFEGCSSLTDVTLNPGVNRIESRAFAATGINEITLPATVRNLSLVTDAFNDCPNFVKFDVDPDNAYYSAVGGVLYNKAQTQLIRIPCAMKAYNWFKETPATCVQINTSAAADYLESGNSVGNYSHVNIPYGIRSIGNYAFYNTPRVVYHIPSSVTNIGNYAFGGITEQLYIYLGHETPPAIPSDVFKDSKLKKLYVPASYCQRYWTADNWKSFPEIAPGGYDFSYVYQPTPTSSSSVLYYKVTRDATADTPGTVMRVYSDMYQTTTILRTVEDRQGRKYDVTQWGDSIFAGKTQLTSITVPAEISNMPRWAFEGCSNLKKVTFEDGYEPLVVGYRSFWGTAVEELEIPASARTIQAEAFDNMPSLKKLVFNRNLATTVYTNAYGVTNANPDLRVYVCWTRAKAWADSVAKWSPTPTKYLNQWVSIPQDSKYQLFSSYFSAERPDQLKAYYITSDWHDYSITGDKATFKVKECTDNFPSQYLRGFILEGTPGKHYMLNTIGGALYDASNVLQGASGAVRFTGDETDAAYYGLASYDEPLTFYRHLGARIGMAYVKLPYDVFKNVSSVQLIFDNGGVRGDINGDGQVNAGDVSELYAIILGTDTTNAGRGDLNADGNINAGDISELYSIILSE